MEYKKICEITSVVTGGTPSTSVDEYWAGGSIPWLQSGCCQNCDVNEAEKFITQAGYDNSSARLMPKDTVMIALTGATAGKLGYLNFEACGNQSITGILPCDLLNQKFLFYYLISKRPQILSDCVGGAQAHISQGYVKNIHVPMCSLAVQEKIVKILDKTMEIIVSRKRELEELDNLIKSRFVEMFGDPICSDKFGFLKVVECVGNKSDMVDGPFGSQVDTKVDYIEDGEIPVIRTVNVKMMEFSLLDLKFMTREKYETVIRSQVLPGDVILTKVGTIGNVCVFPDEFDEAVLSTTGSCRIRVDESKVDNLFFAYNLMYLKPKLMEIASAGVQPFLNMKHVKNIEVLDVPIELQKEFVSFVHQVDKLKFSNLKTELQKILYKGVKRFGNEF